MERWEQLFSDLETSFAALGSQEVADLLQEQIRSEAAQVRMWQRCAGAVGQESEFDLLGPVTIRGKIVAAASQWVLLSAQARQILVPMSAVVSFGAVRGVVPAAVTGPGQPTVPSAAEVTLNRALRTLSRDREPVTVVSVGKQVSGVIGAVSHDHITLLSGGHGEWEQRRAARATIISTAHIAYLYGG